MAGKFIVLDGPDGSGTTTQCEFLSKYLENEGFSTVLTREPTEGPVGKYIRQVLAGEHHLSPDAIQLLFCADRAQHVSDVVLPALEQGSIVICDRYVPSTIIYGEATGVDPVWLEKVNATFPNPDLLLFAMPPIETCLERISRRADKEIFEEDSLARKVYNGYTDFAQKRNIECIDTSQDKQESASQIAALVSRVL